jgi:Tfp pilus assembly protein PilO
MKILLWPSWKKGIAAAVLLLVAADLVLLFAVWDIGRQGPQQMRLRRAQLAEQSALLRADVARGRKIRVEIPQAGQQCDAFYNQAFFDSTTGYSQIETDLDSISKSAGIQTTGLKFQQRSVKGRGVTEIQVSTKVTADYPSLIRFVNGLERSKDFYLLDELKLQEANGGLVDLQIRLHTYFRT